MTLEYTYTLDAVAKIEKRFGVNYSKFGSLFADDGKGLSCADMAFVIEQGSGKPFTGTAPQAFKELLQGALPALLPKGDDGDEAEVEGE
jgi:hypothetical protein